MYFVLVKRKKTVTMAGHSVLGLMLVLAFAMVCHGYDPEARMKEFPDFMVETTVEADNCTQKAKWGDTVLISHTGYYGEQKIDQTKEGEPLRVVMGSMNVLEGMELGMIDQCVGETRKLSIPGPLGFDRDIYRRDPKRQPPVPVGEGVSYEVTIESIEPPPPEWLKYVEMATNPKFWSVFGVVALLLTLTYLVNSVLSGKAAKKDKKKDKKKK
jgi:hypothetical protein